MSRSAVRGAVTDYLAANWTLSELVYQNTTTEPPVASDGVLRPWVYVEVSYNSTDQWSIGETDRTDNRWREDGQVFFHVFTPAGAGLSVADQYADAVIELFKGIQLSPDIEFRDISSDIGGPGDENGNYYRVSISVEWVRN
tara:strand:- start:1231 stop:1653 length:423 start_codon:yes stop_codon:yes gene_type:complete